MPAFTQVKPEASHRAEPTETRNLKNQGVDSSPVAQAMNQTGNLQSQQSWQTALNQRSEVVLQGKFREVLGGTVQRACSIGAKSIAKEKKEEPQQTSQPGTLEDEEPLLQKKAAPAGDSSTNQVFQFNRKKKRLTRGQKKARRKREQRRYERAEARMMEYAEQQPWRVWHQVGEVGGYATERNGVPESTKEIPKRLYHVTNYSALPSIRKNGLDPNYVNTKSGLNVEVGENLKYRVRDAALKAVYMGTSNDPGLLMSSEEALEKGGKVTLMIKVSRAFAMAHFRDSYATGSANEIDDTRSGNTVLSFAKIPPEDIFIEDPWIGPRRITDYPSGFDWRTYANPPKGGKQSDLPSIQELREKERRDQERIEQWKSESQMEMPFNFEQQPQDSGSEDEKGLGIFGKIAIPSFSNNNSGGDEDNSGWEDD
ncbi:MAG: hypothetical protein K1Y36_30615 [Blastocatellia bacterium]|nr:hypothetical protein [Blastocatellia bacterium]